MPKSPDIKALYAGAQNLLRNCIGMRAGQKVLIVADEPGLGHFDDDLHRFVADAATTMGARVHIVIAPPTQGPEDFPVTVEASMQEVDHTIFLSRLGDQLRFSALPGGSSKTMLYTLDKAHLAADFASNHHGLYAEVLQRIVDKTKRVRRCEISCPLGTELVIDYDATDSANNEKASEFSVGLFPVMIYPPLSCVRMSGRLALAHWLLSTSTHAYDESVFRLNDPVVANVSDGHIIGFEGAAETVARLESHFEAVGARSGGDPFALHSWHSGINPRTFYPGDAHADPERSTSVIFGSPRFTHFHCCGAEPGDISCNVMDCSIAFDGEVLWNKGEFVYLQQPEMQKLLNSYPGTEHAFDMRWDIGI